MARILIVEHGPVGSASDLVKAIQLNHPGWLVETNEPVAAVRIASREHYDAIIVDTYDSDVHQVAQETDSFANSARFNPKLPIIFVTNDMKLLTSSRILDRPWYFCYRDPVEISRAADVALHPQFRGYTKG